MAGFDFTQSQEDQIIRELQEAESRRLSYQSKASPQLSQQLGTLYRNHPYAPPGLLLSTAQAIGAGMMDENTANNFVLKSSQNALTQIVQQPKEEKKSWWDRNVASKARTASRWTMAGLNFVPQVATNVASQLFKGDAGSEGFFISTDIGTLIKNDEVAGDGWFLGGKAFELQAERARRYRGEIDGHAWTFGRGFASLIAQPGSREYNILSGLVDAAAAIATPSIPGFAAAKGATATLAGKAGMRTLAGLTDFESAIIQTDKVAGWLQTRGGQSVVRRIKDIKNIDEALDIFTDVQHMDFLNKVVEMTDEGEITRYLRDTLGKPVVDAQGNVGKAVSTIDQINLSRLDDVKRGIAGRSSFVSRMMASVPGQHIVLSGGNPREVAQSVRNVNNYLKTLRVDDATRNDLVLRFSRSLVEKDGNIYNVVTEFDDIFKTALQKMEVPDEAITALRGSMKEFVENKNVYGAIGGVGEGTAYNARVILQQTVDELPITETVTIRPAKVEAEVRPNMLADNAGETIVTGKPVTLNVYRGSGGVARQGQGNQAILGEAFYGTPDFDYAAYFAGREMTGFDPRTNKPMYSDIPGKVEKFEVSLANPLVVIADDVGKKKPGDITWRELTKMAGLKYAKFGITDEPDAPQKLRKVVEDMGHDGIIVRLTDEYGNKVFGTSLQDMMGAEQVIAFSKKTTPVSTPKQIVAVAPSSTAGLESEMLNQLSMVLPDPRRVRRMMSSVGWIYGKGDKLSDPEKYRNLRLPFSALEGFQNEIWRPVTLMTGGYVLRNMTDSAFRYAMTPGLKGGVFHPIQWIQIASRKRFRGTLAGMEWDKIGDDVAERIARQGADEFDIAVGQTIRENFNPLAVEQQGFRDRNWEIVARGSGPKFRKGIQDEISLLHDDQVARLVAQGYDTDEIIDILMTGNKKYVRDLQGRWGNREMQVSGQPGQTVVGTPDLIRADGTFSPVAGENLRYYVDEYVRKRVDAVTGNNAVLRRAVAEGDIEDLDGNTFSIFDLAAGGSRKGYSAQWSDAVQRVIDEDAALIAQGGEGFLKTTYKAGGEIKVFDPNIPGRELPNWLRSWNRTTDKFFSSLYPRRSSYLMQSPVFRQYYWKETGKLIDELDQASLVQIRNNLSQLAQKEGKQLTDAWLARYVGDADTAKTLWARIQNPTAGGKLSLDELDAYAKGSALDQTKNLFYNATEKSNFADILRIAVPFGSAWAEVMNTWGRIAVSNPQAIRRVGVSVQGLRNADPDGDGKGFFWKDPTTGEYVFNYPFSDKIGGLAAALTPIGALAGGVAGGLPGFVAGAAIGAGAGVAGQEVLGLEPTRFVAPLKSLSMGLNIYPGAGPFVQIAANKILTRTPKADFVRDIILPYGEPDITTVGPIPVPSWGRKVIDAIVADPDNSRLLGDLTIDVMRVLHASGDYDLSNDAERERLENDAVSRARVLLVLRGFGQFVGPTRPDIDFKVETEQGDMYTSELSKAFRDMQVENFDTAVERFIGAFGEDFFLYTQGKTQAVAGGLDASQEFGRFERGNGSLFARYGDVAGYFGDVGSNFDYAVYTRQLETGQREKLKPAEFLELAQQTVARALYRSSQRAVGPNPGEIQRDALRQIKTLLQERYPAYSKIVIDINAEEARINEVIRATNDTILDGNPIAEATRVYLKYRGDALQQLATRGIVSGNLSVKAGADLREYLRGVADVLIQQYPEFERMYDRVFYNEIEGM